MEKIIDTIIIVVVAIVGSGAIFVGFNKLFDLPLQNFNVFATVMRRHPWRRQRSR